MFERRDVEQPARSFIWKRLFEIRLRSSDGDQLQIQPKCQNQPNRNPVSNFNFRAPDSNQRPTHIKLFVNKNNFGFDECESQNSS